MTDLIVKIARRDDGKYVAASTASPYFCFEGESEDDVKRIVDLALVFYVEAKKLLNEKRQRKETTITVSRVKSSSRVRKTLPEAA